MNDILALFDNLGFLSALWLFAIAFALHEAEEWNIVDWYHRNWVDLPPITHKDARAWLVFISIVGFVLCAAATLPGNPAIAAWTLFPAIALVFQNALQHVYWLFYFREYAPGIITSVLLLIPLGSYLAARAIQRNYIPVWYVVVLAILIIPGVVQTIKAGNVLIPQNRAMLVFSARLAGWVSKLL